ncbi:hypothetical protein MY04_05695 (plasmid) [Flammeovirga sp. MY04]|uniref:BRCT domain-containing protein n=1 Tax=Flammeovirga sp. MY04 TaxID=1191459 RepID=UPI0008060DC8|nr:BRCT domain-containing protein [Flammeovirga sp. MY04]ANQ52868.1 hypothetical protein MY04_05695 [Flammeovirga sp. MY04]
MNFKGKNYCFTGGLAELKRKKAEQEVILRNGNSQVLINQDLDYLVVGSIIPTDWEIGNYGNKISKTKLLIKNGANIKIVSEMEFMEGLENVSPVNINNVLHSKLLIVRYEALFEDGHLDIDNLEKFITSIHNKYDAHVSASIENPFIYKDLYNKFSDPQIISESLFFQCRIVKKFSISTNSEFFLDTVIKGFESIIGLAGDITWYEKTEGTEYYFNLLNEIPLRTKLQ